MCKYQGGSRTSNRLFFFSSRRRHTRFDCDWSSDVCSSDLMVNSRQEAEAAVCTLPPTLRVPRGGYNIASTAASASWRLFTIGTTTPCAPLRSEERRVGKESRCRRRPDRQPTAGGTTTPRDA